MKKVLLTLAVSLAATQAFAGFGTRGGHYAPMAVLIKFGSLGAGVDEAMVERISTHAKQQQKLGLVALINAKPWGREGEFDLCVEYKNFTVAYESEQQFVALAATAKAPVTVERILNCTDEN